MTWKTHRTERAEADLLDIWDYIADDNPEAADRLIHELSSHFEKTGGFPHLGRAMDRIGDGVRIMPHGSYLLIYRLLPNKEVVELVRVLHGARDLMAIAQRGGFL